MECSLCNVRSSVGFCVECQALLCEECSKPCETCGKPMCPQHQHETRSGSILCLECYDARKTQRRERERAKSSAAEAAEEEGGAVEEEAALLESIRKPPPPWKLSLYAACAGLAGMLFVLVFPSFRRVTMPGMGVLLTPYVLLLIPAIAVFWTLVGLFNKQYKEDRMRCFIGLGIAVLTMGLSFVAVFTDPVRRDEIEARRAQELRQSMTPEQLEQYRQEVLNRYKR